MMAFPTTPLPLITELLINGVWTIVNDGSSLFDRRIADGTTIERGRRDWSSRATASRCSQVFENADGTYSNRNPLSPYYGLLGRNTQIRHRIRWVSDDFNRSASNGWGTATSGQVWTNVAGPPASDFSVAGSGQGKHTMGSVNVFRTSTVPLPVAAYDVTAKVNSSQLATGNTITPRLFFGQDISNYYEAQLSLTTASTVQLSINKRVAGVGSVIVAAVAVGTYAVGVRWSIRLQRTSLGYIRAKAWKTDSANEPTAWTLTTTTPDTGVTTFAIAGLQSRLETGNTNVNPVLSYDDFEVNSYRFTGETSAFSPTADKSGRDVTVPVDASGILQRLSTVAKPVPSALNRAMAGVSGGDIAAIAYWPMEDEAGATRFASALPGQPAGTTTGSVSPAEYSGIVGSKPLPVLNNGSAVFTMPTYADTGIWQIQFTLMIPSSGFSNNADMVIIKMAPGKPTATIYLTYIQATGELQLATFNAAGVIIGGGASFSPVITRDTPYLCAITDFVDAGDHIVAFDLWSPDGTNFGEALQLPDGFGTGSAGMPAQLIAAATSVSSGWSIGHVALYTGDVLNTPNIAPNARGAAGYAGELAGDRLTRLCREQGIPFELIGDAADTKPMGAQRQANLVDLLFDCADVDQGILFEPRDVLGLAYRTGASLYNQTPVALDYASGHIGGTFQPIEDDQLLVNDVTVRRTNGSSSRVEITSGPLSTQEPPNGVGTYDIAPELNLYTDEQTLQAAAWMANKGTFNEPRFPTITVDMANPDVVADGLLGSVAGLDIGGTLSVANPPSWLPPDTVGLMVEGTSEFVGNGMDWSIGFNTVPSGPFSVGIYNDTTKRYDSQFTTTAEALDTTETGVDIAVTAGKRGWITTASHPSKFPFDIVIGGETMRCTANTSTGASTYTMTVTRNVNNLPGGKSHNTGAPVHVRYPGRYAY